MSDLSARIEAAVNRLDEQQRRLTTTVAALSEMDLQLDEGFLEAVDNLVEDVSERSEEFQERSEKFPEQVAAQLDASAALVGENLDAGYKSVEAAWATLNESFDAVRALVEALPPPAQQQFARVVERLQVFEVDISSQNDELKGGLLGAASNAQTLLNDQVLPAGQELAQRAHQFSAQLEGALRSSFDSTSASARAMADSAFGEFGTLSNDAIDKLNTTVENAVQAFTEELRTTIESRIPEAKRDLINDASEALAKEIIEGIAMSTVGAQISTAMSPYIAYLVAIKRILDALLHAIRLFKNPLREF
jgi:hypothetical protein